jgi:hypothetical protein
MKIKIGVSAFVLTLILLYSCNSIRQIGFKPEDTEFVKACRQNWIYSDLTDTVSIRLLLQDKEGRYDLVSWPNLFIGVTNQNDTIGIIDNFSTLVYKKNKILTFMPYYYGTEPQKGLSGLWPVFTVHRNDKKNKLYCSVNNLYYGKLIENK